MVTPTGFQPLQYAANTGKAGETREVPGLYRLLHCAACGAKPSYALLVSQRGIRYFLRRTFGSSAIDEGLVEYDYLTSHQPGAQNAPYAFVSGRLFSSDILLGSSEPLTLPVSVPHATRGDFRDFSVGGLGPEDRTGGSTRYLLARCRILSDRLEFMGRVRSISAPSQLGSASQSSEPSSPRP